MDELSVISALVEHKPGVLYKVSNMFRRRGFNIESITVGPAEAKDLARMTITVRGDEMTRDQVVKQLKKLIDVIYAEILPGKETVQRELALIKVELKSSDIRREIMDYTAIFRGRIIDASLDTVIAEVTGTSEKIDAFINIAERFGVLEIARTGITALLRGKTQ